MHLKETDMFTHAIVRRPGENFADGITTSSRGRPVYTLLMKQHSAYVETLASLGLEIIMLDALSDYPDAYFVEDTAVVTPDVAVAANPGAETRKGEEESVVPVLSRFRKILRIQAPGTLDGGDVLMAGRHFFIGISERTNADGAGQLGRILGGSGNTWTVVRVESGLHLKSGVNYIGKNRLLVSEDFAGLRAFSRYEKIIVKRDETYACNTLLINNCLITPRGFPDTRKKLETTGYDIVELDVSEAQKMDGGLTCMSIRF